MTKLQDRDQDITGGWIETGLLFVLPGVLQGIAFWWLVDNGEELAGSPLLQFALMFTLVAPTAWFLTMTTQRRAAAAVFAVALGALTGGLFAFSQHYYGGFADNAESAVVIAFFANALICYIAAPFFRTVVDRGAAPTHYPSLFEFAWNLPVILATAVAFVGVVWLVLALWMGLFATIGIDFFRELFTEDVVASAITFGAAAMAIHTVREREGVVLAMRNILFALLRLLAPVVALATGLYLIAGGAQGLSGLEVGDWSLTVTMVSAIAAGVVLTNAVLGEAGPVANPLLRWVVRVQSLILPFLAAIAVYAIWIRLNEHGVTVARVYAAIIVAFACGYALVYAIGAVLPRGGGLVRQANIYLAGGIFLIAILIQTPVINPYQMTVDSQYARLQSGKTAPEDFDFQYFRWEMGRYGEKMFERIEGDPDLPEHEYLVSQVNTYRKSDSRYGASRVVEEERTRTKFEQAVEKGNIILLPAPFEFSNEHIDSLRYSTIGNCLRKEQTGCVIRRMERAGQAPFYIGIAPHRYNKDQVDISVVWPTDNEPRYHYLQPLKFGTPEARDAFMERVIGDEISEKLVSVQALDIAGQTVLYAPEDWFDLLAPENEPQEEGDPAQE